ncbi:hypothetical protein ABE10_02815, partial [Bacillus toyonensis]|nr:hypothetical protein [Bacillus toyonensis]
RLLGDEPQALADRDHHIRDVRAPPGDEVEAGAAAEGRDVDDAVEAVPQHRGQQVLDRMQPRGGDLALVGLHEAH